MEPEEEENGSVWDWFLVWFFLVLFLVGWEGWVFRDSSSIGWMEEHCRRQMRERERERERDDAKSQTCLL